MVLESSCDECLANIFKGLLSYPIRPLFQETENLLCPVIVTVFSQAKIKHKCLQIRILALAALLLVGFENVSTSNQEDEHCEDNFIDSIDCLLFGELANFGFPDWRSQHGIFDRVDHVVTVVLKNARRITLEVISQLPLFVISLDKIE